MPNAAGIIAKTDAALRRVNANDRVVYKRVTTRTGGDALIGSPASISYTDVALSPPPVFQRLGRNIVGNNIEAERVISSGGAIDQIGTDYSMYLSPTAISKSELENLDLTFVFKDSSGNEEVFRISDYEFVPFQGRNVGVTVYLRSTKRPDGS